MHEGDCHHTHDEADARVDVAQQVCGLKELRVASGPVPICCTQSPSVTGARGADLCQAYALMLIRSAPGSWHTVLGLPASVHRHEAVDDKAGKDDHGCSGQRRAQHKPAQSQCGL